MNNAKKKIAIIGSRGYPISYSGFETFVRNLAEGLIKKDFEITVYCHSHLFNEKPQSVNGIQLVYLSTSKRKNFSQLIHSFKSVFHACYSKYDVIFAVNSANGFFGIIPRIFGIPCAINVDGIEWARPKWNILGKLYFYLSSWASTMFYNAIITDAEGMADIYRNKFRSNSDVIEYGARINHSDDFSSILQFNVTPQEYYLIVGRFIPDNNWDSIIDSFLKSNSKKQFLILGDVPYEDNYVKKLKSINDSRLQFLGHIHDRKTVNQLMKHSFAYIHGHQFGGTNPTLLEALANSAKIIAIDTVFTREVLDNGKYGFYFKKNGNSLTNLINKIELNNSLLNKISKGSDRIREKYNWERILNLYSDLFHRITN